MKKNFEDPEFFKQIRADGTEFFTVTVYENRLWFFGLLQWRTKYYIYTDGNFYLTKDSAFQWLFRSLNEAEVAVEEAIKKRHERMAFDTVVSFIKVMKNKSNGQN